MRLPLVFAPGLDSDDTRTAAKGAFADADKIRFRDGKAQTEAGYVKMVDGALTGVCRNILAYSDTAGLLNTVFGTHSALQVVQYGTIYSVTPTLALPPSLLEASPLAVTNGSPLVTVTHAAHGLATGASVTVSGAAAVGGITPNGTFTITVLTTGTYRYTFTSNATSTASGGGSAVVIQPQAAFVAGNADGTGGAGFGTGTYSGGVYGAPSTSVSYPRTWSLSAYGGSLMACPRGGTIYWWQGDTGNPAPPLQNAPAQVSAMLVPPNRRQVLAFGCTDTSGVFDPVNIRWSGLQAPTTWAPADGTVAHASSTAGEYRLESGGRIVGARAIGDSILVWTDSAVYRGDYTGDVARLWTFSKLADHCGLMGPNAAVVVSQTAYWLSTGGQFWVYGLGGVPEPAKCPILTDFRDNIAVVQQDKIVASSNSGGFSEIRFDYPDGRDGFENSRFLLLETVKGAWSRGLQARTARTDSDPSPLPLAADPAGVVWFHEQGATADGGALSFMLESADLVLGADPVMIRELWPDFQNQTGAVSAYIIARDHPQGAETTYGPFVCAPDQSRVCLRITARVARLRLESNTGPSFWRMGQPSLEVTPAGRIGRR